ncbi:hypothetical protein [Mycobacterium sp. 852014-52144_SCH5372336]|uniref:hypothetical protein n=1 Tax=Mycobacterium sp. 852014-52144_SCH5372336 TaxID=1834115 RepID=UPI0007FF869D|nr:hypothetical protein [Mycobacterium sp. 852014-52144_SCH5372336]OBB74328.1 hypothetical protein A5759_12155 [Mycobacterium sp. 852014-52144_SCH5372336]
MLSAIAIVPSAPVMVPELAGGAAPELADLREAVFTAVVGLPSRWVAIGVGPCDQIVGPDQAGTFAGYGVDVRVALSPGGDGDPVAMPLCALITGWVRGAARSEASAEVRVFSDGHDLDVALAHGERLRAEIGEGGNPVGVLVVADGANTLTPSAPGGFDPDSVAVQAALDDALAGGETAPLARLPASVVGRVAFGVLAGLVGPGPRSAKELYRGAPYGVGYFTGLWQPR